MFILPMAQPKLSPSPPSPRPNSLPNTQASSLKPQAPLSAPASAVTSPASIGKSSASPTNLFQQSPTPKNLHPARSASSLFVDPSSPPNTSPAPNRTPSTKSATATLSGTAWATWATSKPRPLVAVPSLITNFGFAAANLTASSLPAVLFSPSLVKPSSTSTPGSIAPLSSESALAARNVL